MFCRFSLHKNPNRQYQQHITQNNRLELVGTVVAKVPLDGVKNLLRQLVLLLISSPSDVLEYCDNRDSQLLHHSQNQFHLKYKRQLFFECLPCNEKS